MLTLNGGTIQRVGGTPTIASGAVLNITRAVSLEDNTLTNDGVSTLTASLTLLGAGVYNNSVLGQTDFQGDVGIGGSFSPTIARSIRTRP